MYRFIEALFQITIIKESLAFGITSAILALFISPLQFLKIQRQASGSSYLNILKYQYSAYGILIFFVGAIPYALLQFFSSASFGVSEFLSTNLIIKFGLQFSLISILIKAIFAGIFETGATIFFEMKAIEKNKVNLLEIAGTARSIIFSLFFRNTLFWLGPLLAIFIINLLKKKYHFDISNIQIFSISFLVSLASAILTIPFDVVTTQNFGSDEKIGIFERLKKNIFEGGYREIFRGALMRVLASTLFSICTVLTEYFLHN